MRSKVDFVSESGVSDLGLSKKKPGSNQKTGFGFLFLFHSIGASGLDISPLDPDLTN